MQLKILLRLCKDPEFRYLYNLIYLYIDGWRYILSRKLLLQTYGCQVIDIR